MQSYFFSSHHHPYMRQISQRIALIGHGLGHNNPKYLLILTEAFLEKDSDKYQQLANAKQGYA